MTNTEIALNETTMSSPLYLKAFALGKSDAAAGCPFSRYVLQHGAVARVDYRGHAVKVPAHETGEIFHGRAYVAGCCAK